MLLALMFRGVAFEFRAKTGVDQRRRWDLAFSISSLIVPLAQGYMLGRYLMGLDDSLWSHTFAATVGLALTAGYVMMGSGWLILKSDGLLQQKSLKWMRISLVASAVGMIFVSIVTPLISERIFYKWFSLPEFSWVAPLPIITACVFWHLWKTTKSNISTRCEWMPLAHSALIFNMGFAGLAYSFFPYIVPEKLTIIEAATSYESLVIMFYGTLCVLPLIICYTFFAYWLFSGKAKPLTYN
jgi:cytochrome d ubiquinol oxidase subunit II